MTQVVTIHYKDSSAFSWSKVRSHFRIVSTGILCFDFLRMHSREEAVRPIRRLFQ